MGTKGPYRVKVTVGDAVVEVEGEEKGVVSIVEALGNVLRSSQRVVGASSLPSVLEPTPRASQVDIRTFFKEKSPSSDIEAAAVAAYYFKYVASAHGRKDAIDARTLEDAFRLGGRPLPSKTAWTLANAKGAGYLDSVGVGTYRLNPVGFNLVEHTLGKGERTPEKQPIRKRRTRPSRKVRPAT